MSAKIIAFPAARVHRDKEEQLAHAKSVREAWWVNIAMRLAARVRELEALDEEKVAMEELARVIADRVRASPKRARKPKEKAK